MVAITLITSTSEPGSVAIAAAMERAILADEAADSSSPLPATSAQGDVTINVATAESERQPSRPLKADILCPLTLVPDVSFPRQQLYNACRDVAGLRQRVSAEGYSVGEGNLWIPLVLTAKGPLYGEAIGQDPLTGPSGSIGQSFQQPVYLSDAQRQPLYRLGRWLLTALTAPPAVYLLQAACQGDRITFDRLWPFPAAPALASQGRQSPDLFVCHWRCLIEKPVRDLQIRP